MMAKMGNGSFHQSLVRSPVLRNHSIVPMVRAEMPNHLCWFSFPTGLSEMPGQTSSQTATLHDR